MGDDVTTVETAQPLQHPDLLTDDRPRLGPFRCEIHEQEFWVTSFGAWVAICGCEFHVLGSEAYGVRAYLVNAKRDVLTHIQDGHDATIRSLHIDDITIYVLLPAELLSAAVARLAECHQHVFIVDQSYRHTGSVGVGVTGAGERCLQEAFPDILPTP